MNSKGYVFLLASFFIVSFNGAYAQNGCNNDSFFLTKGTKWVYSTYKEQNLHSSISIRLDTIYFFNTTTVFLTEESISVNNIGGVQLRLRKYYMCSGSDISYRSELLLDSDSLKSLDFNPDYLDEVGSIYNCIPSDLSIGQKLEDQTITTNGGQDITVISNRSVISFETIVTSVGAFDCYLITKDIVTVSSGKKVNTFVKEWFSEEVGLVRTETYSKKGKLKNSEELTEFSN